MNHIFVVKPATNSGGRSQPKGQTKNKQIEKLKNSQQQQQPLPQQKLVITPATVKTVSTKAANIMVVPAKTSLHQLKYASVNTSVTRMAPLPGEEQFASQGSSSYERPFLKTCANKTSGKQ